MVDHYEPTPADDRDLFFRAWLGVPSAIEGARIRAERLYGPLREHLAPSSEPVPPGGAA